MSSDDHEKIEIVLANGEIFEADLTSLAKLFENEYTLLKEAAEKRIQVRHDKFLPKTNFLEKFYEVPEHMRKRTFAERIYTLPESFGRHPFGVPALMFYAESSFSEKNYYEKDEQWKIVFSNFMNSPIASVSYNDEEGIHDLINLIHQPIDSLETMLFLKNSEDESFMEKIDKIKHNVSLFEYATHTLNVLSDVPSIDDYVLTKMSKETDFSFSRINIIDPQLYRYVEALPIAKLYAAEQYNVKQINEIIAPYGLVSLSGYRKTDFFSPQSTTKYVVLKEYKKLFKTCPREVSQVFVPPAGEYKKSIFSFLMHGMDGVLNDEPLTISQRNKLVESIS
jgi:hypothetical protein